MHRLSAETAQEPQRDEVKIAIEEAVPSHELRLTELTGLMMNRFLANLVETGILCQIRYVAVHLAIHLDVFHNITAVSLQTTIEVMQIVYAAYLPCRGIEELRRDSLRERVTLLTVHLVSRHEVITFLRYHPVEFRNLVGRILQVGIHSYHHIACSFLESAI